MPALRHSLCLSLALVLIGLVYLVAPVSQLPARGHPHNLAYDTEDAIDEMMWKTPYKGRDYFSDSADVYDRDAFSKTSLVHSTDTDTDVERAAWLRDQIDRQEAENLAAWRDREMARLDQEGSQDDFQSFDPLAQNPVRNPVRNTVHGDLDPMPGSVSTRVVTPVVSMKRRPKMRIKVT